MSKITSHQRRLIARGVYESERHHFWKTLLKISLRQNRNVFTWPWPGSRPNSFKPCRPVPCPSFHEVQLHVDKVYDPVFNTWMPYSELPILDPTRFASGGAT